MTQHYSPGLAAIFKEFERQDKPAVLDLGPTNQRNFNKFSELSRKFHFDDLRDLIIESQDQENLTALIEQHLLAYGVKGQFDVVLLWDLFNYISLDNVLLVIDTISQYCKADTLMHMVRYASNDIPNPPAKFSVLDEQFIDIEIESTQARDIGLHNTSGLLKKMPGFYMENTLVNQEGMHRGIIEHVLRFEPTKDKRLVQSTKNQFDQPLALNDAIEHKSFAFSKIIDHLSQLTSSKVLMIGKKQAQNFDYLESQCSQLFVEDVFTSTQWRKTQGQSGLSPNILSFASGTQFDVIILGDIINYLSDEDFTELLLRVGQFSKPGHTKLMLMSHILKTVPAKPAIWYLHSNDTTSFSKPDQEKQLEQTISSAQLMKRLTGCSIEQSFVFQKGMSKSISEFLFVINQVAA